MVNQAPKAPGTVAGNRPMPGTKSKPLSRKKDGVAKAGATPCPQRTRMRFSDSLHSMMGASPPGPFRCGSTICNMNPPATAASKALPPFSSTPMATCDASQCVDDTTPNVPRSEEHTSELQSLMRISYAVFCLNKKNNTKKIPTQNKYN